MVWDNALLSSPLLRSIAPKSLAGYARFREATDKDGALPARIKALYITVAATMKGYEAMARRELARGRALGLGFAEAASGAAILCSVRGEGAAASDFEHSCRRRSCGDITDVRPSAPEDFSQSVGARRPERFGIEAPVHWQPRRAPDRVVDLGEGVHTHALDRLGMPPRKCTAQHVSP